MRILNVVGARPNFMKIAPLMAAWRDHPQVEPLLLHTGQHYDHTMSDLFFEELGIPRPDINLEVRGGSHAYQHAAVMQAFAAGNIDLLVATTVIEVGVDVPKASLMIIENPERLGLAQLHQLRGRVGRGSLESSCVLLYQPPLSDTARQRLAVLRDSTDGFVIAERDLELRGPGEVLGTRQTGEALFKVADLQRDAGLLDRARQLADTLLSRDTAAAEQLVRRWVGAAARYAKA